MKLTIIIPCYNSMKFIEETIETCINQSVISKEIIIIDDCSSDGTVEYLLKKKIEFPDLVLIFNNENLGLPVTVNKALHNAKGEFVSVVGHDDFFSNNHFEKMINIFEDETVLVYCNSQKVNSKSQIIVNKLGEKVLVLDSGAQKANLKNVNRVLGNWNFISSCGMVIKKSAIDGVDGWSTKYKIYGEWFLYTKLIKVGNFKFCSSTFGNYRIHDTNISKKFFDIDIQRTLHYYYQECRRSVLKNPKLSVLDSIIISFFIVKYEVFFNVKNIIR